MASRTSTLFATALVLTATAGLADEPFFTGSVPAETVTIGEPHDTYGTASLTAYLIPAPTFTGSTNTVAYSTATGIDRFITTAAGLLVATPMLPNGSQIERIELRACDTNATAQVLLGMGTCPTGGSNCLFAGGVGTGVTAVPGCNTFSSTLAVPLIVNNETTPILVNIATGTTNATTFSAVKLYYRLRVSPAGVTASFNDVPVGHPQRQFIEALAASGITGGCGPGIYCPDSAVTRGQMAVFLSVALGLHFPN